MYRLNVDTFTSLDDLPKKDRRDPIKVLAALARAGRFSAFDVDHSLGETFEHILRHTGWIARWWGEYPWTYVELSEKGKAALAPSPPSDRHTQER